MDDLYNGTIICKLRLTWTILQEISILVGTSSKDDELFIAMFDYSMVSHLDLPEKCQESKIHVNRIFGTQTYVLNMRPRYCDLACNTWAFQLSSAASW